MRSTTSLGRHQSGSVPWAGYASAGPSSLEKLVPGAHYQQPGQPSPPSPEGGPPWSNPNGNHDRPPGCPGGHHPDLFQPKTVKFWAIIFCNFLCLFLVALDRTILATAVPRITDEFKALGDIGWYGSAYMLATACAQLVYGRIYKFYDMKWTFLISLVVFEIGSTICGAAPSSVVFIIGRAIAGLASAGIFSGSMLSMIPMIPLHRRPAFQGLFGMVFGMAGAMGPLIGGALTEVATWRWCFYINLPAGVVALVVMILVWNPPKQQRRHYGRVTFLGHIKRLDPVGMFFFVPATVSLLLCLQWGGSVYRWDEWRIVMLFGVAGMATIGFISVQIIKPNTAMVPPRIITQRSVALGVSFTFFLSASMLLLMYFIPIWFQTVKRASPIQSGVNTLPLVLSFFVSSILSGIITQAAGYYVPSMLIAPAIMSVGEALMTTFNRDTPPSQWIAYQFLSGFGLGFGMQTSALAIQTVLPKEDISIGLAINFFLQQLGGAISTSIGQTILSNILVQRLTQVPDFNGTLIVAEGATHIVDLVTEPYKGVVLDAYNFASQRIFLVAACMAFAALLCALGMEWKTIKKSPNSGGPPVAGGPPGAGPSTSPHDSEADTEGRNLLGRPGIPNGSRSWRPAGWETNAHVATGVLDLDSSGSLHSNSPLYGGAIPAPVVFIPYSGDPGNPYGQMDMPSPNVYGGVPYYQPSPSRPAMTYASVPYMHPSFGPSSLSQVDGILEPLCRNCRCSLDGAAGMPPEHSGTTNPNGVGDEEREERRSLM